MTGGSAGSWSLAGWARVAPAIAIVGAALAFVALNLPRLGEQSFWTDELISVTYANQSAQWMLRLQAGDIHPPFYAAVIWLWIRITHDATEAAVRLVSLLAITAGIVTLAHAAWRRIGPGAAAVVTSLAMTSTLVASFAREARPHGLAFALMATATAGWLFVLRRDPIRLRHLVWFAVAGGLASLTQYYALMVYALESAVLLGFLLVARRWREMVLTAAITGLSVVPVGIWLLLTRQFAIASSTPTLTMAWVEEVAGWAAEPFTTAIFGVAPDGRHSVLLIAGIVGLAIIMLAVSALLERRRGVAITAEASEQWGLGAAALTVAVAAVAIGTVQSMVHLPTLHFRSIMSILPVLQLGLGLAFTVPWGRAGGAVGLGIAAILAATAASTEEPGLYVKDQWREAAAIVRSEAEAGLPAGRIVVVEKWGPGAWIVELNNAYGRRAPATDLPAGLRGLTWIQEAADLAAVPAGGSMLLVAFHHWAWHDHETIVAAVQEGFAPCEDRSVVGITILRCAGSPAR